MEPFVLIKGTFHVAGYSPDGDSIRFRARDDRCWNDVPGRSLQINARGHVQTRIEAIDTLELHYGARGTGPVHQPLEVAAESLAFLLQGIGIRDVRWDEARGHVLSAHDGTSGYILTRGTEGNGRPIAFVFAGDIDRADGQTLVLDAEHLQRSLNYRSLASGLAYPTFYGSLQTDLCELLSRAVRQARAQKLGVWTRDCTLSGVRVRHMDSVTREQVMWPKLFRRLVAFIADAERVSPAMLSQFPDALSRRAEAVLEVSTGRVSQLHRFVRVQNDVVRLTVPPEELVFLPN